MQEIEGAAANGAWPTTREILGAAPTLRDPFEFAAEMLEKAVTASEADLHANGVTEACARTLAEAGAHGGNPVSTFIDSEIALSFFLPAVVRAVPLRAQPADRDLPDELADSRGKARTLFATASATSEPLIQRLSSPDCLPRNAPSRDVRSKTVRRMPGSGRSGPASRARRAGSASR